jgi:CDP-diacylglycerol--glycerol-3-phosphate 3-phosphatidyltransferase
MPSLYDLKPRFLRLLRPIVDRLAAVGATPNQVTVAAALLSIATGAAIATRPASRWPLLLLPAVLLVRMALNAIDGLLARAHALRSRLGAILNELGDVVSDAALYLPLALVPGVGAAAVVAVVVLAVISEVAGLAAVQVGAARRYDGPMGKSDRALWLGALALAVGAGIDPAGWAEPALWAIAALLGVTIVNRVRGALGAAG